MLKMQNELLESTGDRGPPGKKEGSWEVDEDKAVGKFQVYTSSLGNATVRFVAHKRPATMANSKKLNPCQL